MKKLGLQFFLVAMSLTGMLNAQNLYNIPNAASIENEANNTQGWTGTASITSDASTSQNGTYSIRIAVQGTGREARYSFSASIGSIYNISIWARRTATSNNPAFANWLGLQGFTTTVIQSQAWTQYNFVVTATITSPSIRIYAGPIGSASGMEVFIDAISILPQTPPDNQPPSTPSNFSASEITMSSANLHWDPSTDNVGVDSYTIKQNGTEIISLAGSITGYVVENLLPGTIYYFSILASDAANNVSIESDSILVTTLMPEPDTIPPSIPVNLSASGITQTGLTLTWDPSVDNSSVSHYIIWQDSLIIDSFHVGISYNVTGLSPQTSYSYFIQSVDLSSNTSLPSDTIIVTTVVTGQIVEYNDTNANLPTINWQANNFYAAGYAGIGTAANTNFRLSVDGAIRAKEVIVESGWSDFVFEPGYDLITLHEVEKFISENGHLPNIPSAAEVQSEGIGLSKANTLLLQKIEELTLYLITIEKRLTKLENLNRH